ncbi:cytidine deaminase [Egibacter rhizosphaerae]|uniref:Cytidine deaminase n=1 Tax=Egibacter rhizosphaerae TaxID=1670831 RepID=A0A411YBP8_9ACTN|nr:cytidine deaminase [Egibacter rhizosphaerae]QBI18629.1 cytidine deaminase [Egibacter rhizosphaerae]
MAETEPAETASDEELLELARAARTGAYAPYSSFRVGAALGTADGRVFTGANVENASMPAGVCAERVAVPQAIMAGATELMVIAVAGDGDGPCLPCGICRQVLYEFSPALRVLATGVSGATAEFVLEHDLLPNAFGPADLR